MPYAPEITLSDRELGKPLYLAGNLVDSSRQHRDYHGERPVGEDLTWEKQREDTGCKMATIYLREVTGFPYRYSRCLNCPFTKCLKESR
jgi:hypothetical protein